MVLDQCHSIAIYTIIAAPCLPQEALGLVTSHGSCGPCGHCAWSQDGRRRHSQSCQSASRKPCSLQPRWRKSRPSMWRTSWPRSLRRLMCSPWPSGPSGPTTKIPSWRPRLTTTSGRSARSWRASALFWASSPPWAQNSRCCARKTSRSSPWRWPRLRLASAAGMTQGSTLAGLWPGSTSWLAPFTGAASEPMSRSQRSAPVPRPRFSPAKLYN